MQNDYIRIEDMPSLVSHKLSIIKYVVFKKIIFYFLCFDRLIWTWTWLGLEPLWTRTSLDSVLTRTRTSLDLDLSWTRQRWTWLQPYEKLGDGHHKHSSCYRELLLTTVSQNLWLAPRRETSHLPHTHTHTHAVTSLPSAQSTQL